MSKERFWELYSSEGIKRLSASNPYYVVPNDTYENSCYDLITDSYEIPRLMMGYEYCNITGHDYIDYPSKTNVTRTDKMFQEYIKRYWQYTPKMELEEEPIATYKNQ